MAEEILQGTQRRRSQRVMLRLRVVVHGRSAPNEFVEETLTAVVNAHGALIELAAHVETGQTLVLENRGTRQMQECRVVHIGPKNGGKLMVGIEFAQPAPRFWQIAFPPEDWQPCENPVGEPVGAQVA